MGRRQRPTLRHEHAVAEAAAVFRCATAACRCDAPAAAAPPAYTARRAQGRAWPQAETRVASSRRSFQPQVPSSGTPVARTTLALPQALRSRAMAYDLDLLV